MSLNKFGALALPILLSACSTVPPVKNTTSVGTPSTNTSSSQMPMFPSVESVDFFLTYMSEEAMQPCEMANTACMEDPIPALTWFQILQAELAPMHLDSDGETTDYEILVASQLRETYLASADANTLLDMGTQYSVRSLHSEITLQWRGFALDTYSTSSALDDSNNYAVRTEQMVQRWKNHAASYGIFTRDFLYSSLQASNYRTDLTMPTQLGEFYLEDTQLYADPFRGAVSRFRHPVYENAILDITVSPILTQLDSFSDDSLKKELEQELQRAEEVASTKQMALTIDIPISPFDSGETFGQYFAVHAFDEFDEPLYAATYLFKQEDKWVKFTSSFPDSVATPLVKEAMATLVVPPESRLMEEIRATF